MSVIIKVGIAGDIATLTIHGEPRLSFRLAPLQPHGRLIDADELKRKLPKAVPEPCENCNLFYVRNIIYRY